MMNTCGLVNMVKVKMRTVWNNEVDIDVGENLDWSTELPYQIEVQTSLNTCPIIGDEFVGEVWGLHVKHTCYKTKICKSWQNANKKVHTYTYIYI